MEYHLGELSEMALLSQLCIDMDKYIEFHRNLRALSTEMTARILLAVI